ncbi:CoA activase, partial [Candidatus Sumerlaeota bacterium]|nr:CoA activase [Candidatus Sumerlaeota bacterium]
MTMDLCIGIDVGSVAIKTYVTDQSGNLLFEGYDRTNGLPFHTSLRVLEGILERYKGSRVSYFATTGSGGKELSDLVGGDFVNEVVAQARAVAAEIPHVRTVIEMGGEDSKLLFFKSEDGRCLLEDFSMNALCAAGTGSFLDQQAVRLGVSIEKEFGELALQCGSPPRIAGRCSVFAKSDMIHLQQVGAPVPDIVSGLCHALARNFKASIGKG